MLKFDLAGAAGIPSCGGGFDSQGRYVPPDESDTGADADVEDFEPSDWRSFAGIDAERVLVGAGEEAASTSDDEIADRFVDGAAWLFDTPDAVDALWGMGTRVLWAAGEALTITGSPGVGKTSVAAQVIGASLGLRSEVLGLPVTECSRVLYLAMDRPRQAKRNLRRFFSAEQRAAFAGRLVVWEGPPFTDFAVDSDAFLELCAAAGLEPGDRVVVDSIKDAAVGLSEDRVGAEYNRSRQKVLRAGVDVLELHHMVKKAGDGPPRSLADVYGSQHLTAGAGSVVLLHGVAGDPVVTLLHLKQPSDDVGPLIVTHATDGTSTVNAGETDVAGLVAAMGKAGATVTDIAVLLFDKRDPSRGDIEKTRRRLNEAVARGVLVRLDGHRGGGSGGRNVTRWYLRAEDAEG